MPLNFVITDAGRAAIAQVGGAIGPVTLTKIAIGSAGYTPLANRTALQTEIKRLDPSGSSVPVPGTISLTAQDNSADSYSVKEIGLITNNNVLFAICAQSAVIMTKASGSTALFAMDFVMTNVPAGTVTVGNVGFTYSQATETAMGVLGIATTAEAQAGMIDTKIITPLKMAQVTATESRKGVIALATSAEAQALAPDATKALTVARLVDRTATTSRAGVVVLASSTDTQTGTDTAKAVTPAGLASRTATESRAGIVQLASTTEASAGTITTKAVTPAALKFSLAAYSGSTHTHAASAIVSGTIDNLRLPSRLQATPQHVTDWNNALENGWFHSSNGTNAPEGVIDWWLGFVEAHTLNYVTQTVHRFTGDNSSNTQIWRRSCESINNVGVWGAWYKLQLSQAEQDARYLLTATDARAGIVELADNTETQNGTATNRAVTPAGLASRTATDTRAGIVELATNTETQAGLLTTVAVTPASLASAAALFVPPGAVMPFAMNAAPSGWLAANGAAVSRTTYAALFTAIGTLYGAGNGSTTFALPDLRGYFVRGSGTNSDGTVSGTFGAKQADAFQGHAHSSSSLAQRVKSGSVIATGNGWTGENQGTSVGNPTNDGTNGDPRTASETRPKNIALLYCIKI